MLRLHGKTILLLFVTLSCTMLALKTINEDRSQNKSVQLKVSTVRILFHANQCGSRGTDRAAFDYALFGELFYDMLSFHVFPAHMVQSLQQRQKLESAFPGRVVAMPTGGRLWHDNITFYASALTEIVQRFSIHFLYKIEAGTETNLVLYSTPTVVHAVFECGAAHGAAMMAISPSVEAHGGNCGGIVSHMVWMPVCEAGSQKDHLRQELGISPDSFVFGWFGGEGSWDQEATAIVREVALQGHNRFMFVFMNFPPDQAMLLEGLENVKLLAATNDIYQVCKFGQTINLYLHTRPIGETFGLAVAEMSLLGLPTLTSGNTRDRAHIDILHPDVYTYSSYDTLRDTMLNMSHATVHQADFAAHYKPFSPFKVMSEFNSKFLNSSLSRRQTAADIGQRLDLTELFGNHSDLQLRVWTRLHKA